RRKLLERFPSLRQHLLRHLHRLLRHLRLPCSTQTTVVQACSFPSRIKRKKDPDSIGVFLCPKNQIKRMAVNGLTRSPGSCLQWGQRTEECDQNLSAGRWTA